MKIIVDTIWGPTPIAMEGTEIRVTFGEPDVLKILQGKKIVGIFKDWKWAYVATEKGVP